jgi:hypothetical protein
MVNMLCDNGIIALNTTLTGVFGTDGEEEEEKIEFVDSEKKITMYKSKKMEITPFEIYSGGGTDLVRQFFGKIKNNQSLHVELDDELKIIYEKLFEIGNSSIKNCKNTNNLMWENCNSRSDLFKYLCMYQRNLCEPDENVNQFIDYLYSDNIKEKMHQFIKFKSSIWTPPYYDENNIERVNKKYFLIIKKEILTQP